MKRAYLIFTGLFLFISCDKFRYFDYFIVNECDESISVYIDVGRNNVSKIIIILPNDTTLVHQGEAFTELEDRLVEFYFNEITITKGGTVSKNNYINRNRWDFKPTSKYHANSYLTVKPGDFE